MLKFALISIVAVIGLVAIMWGIQWATAPIRGALDAREQIQADGSFRIAAYDSFFNQCASIQGLEGRLDVAFKQLDQSPESNRLSANVAGLQGLRFEAIAKYNGDAAKEYTEGQFRDSDLPYQLPAKEYNLGDRKTQCSGF